ncbi:MAG: energy transducer TonB [Deltaproteobacteria bacterium]
MATRYPFALFLGLSFLFHIGLLGLVPRPAAQPAQPQRTIEIAYQGHMAVARQPAAVPSPEMQRSPLEKNTKAIADFIKKDLLKITPEPPQERPYTPKTQKSISMPTIPGEMLKSPEYRSYYSLVREKIRKYAYFYYRRLEEGDVYLTFSLAPDGSLLNLAVDEAKSSAHAYLKDVARQSVQEAAPYPPFPQKLKDNRELAFNVIIDFKLK